LLDRFAHPIAFSPCRLGGETSDFLIFGGEKAIVLKRKRRIFLEVIHAI